MSDNPADSLRRELEAAVLKSLIRHMLSPYEATAASVASDLWPLVEAARADERERIEKAVEAECSKHLRCTVNDANVAAVVHHQGFSDGLNRSLAVVRGAVSDGD